jgi:hypothetical protein
MMSGGMPSLGIAELIIILVAIGIFLLPMIFFLLTLQKAISRCALESRAISPGQVWLLLIPLFNLVWVFIVVGRVATTLGNEFRLRNMPAEPEPGKSIGLAWAICTVCSIIPFLGLFAGIAALVCWIIYWVKVAGYSGRLAFPGQPQMAGPPQPGPLLNR